MVNTNPRQEIVNEPYHGKYYRYIIFVCMKQEINNGHLALCKNRFNWNQLVKDMICFIKELAKKIKISLICGLGFPITIKVITNNPNQKSVVLESSLKPSLGYQFGSQGLV